MPQGRDRPGLKHVNVVRQRSGPGDSPLDILRLAEMTLGCTARVEQSVERIPIQTRCARALSRHVAKNHSVRLRIGHVLDTLDAHLLSHDLARDLAEKEVI